MAPPGILVLGEFRQEDHEFWASLGPTNFVAGKKDKKEEEMKRRRRGGRGLSMRLHADFLGASGIWERVSFAVSLR